MSSEREGSLDPDVRALLDAVDEHEAAADDAIVARLRDRFDIALAANASLAAPPPSVATPLPTTTPRRVLSLLGTFAAGAIVALAVEHALPSRSVNPPPPPSIVGSPVPVDVPAPMPSAHLLPASSAAPTPSVASTVPSPRAASSLKPVVTTASASPATDRVRDGDLATETRLVDTARSALAHGDFSSALAAAKSHEQRFGSGRLAEEREAIMIQALAGAHQDAEAASRAETFRARYPTSFFLPLVNRAVGAVP